MASTTVVDKVRARVKVRVKVRVRVTRWARTRWLHAKSYEYTHTHAHTHTGTQDGSEFGKVPQVSTFYGSRLTVRKADGALVTTSVSCYASMLYNYIKEARWEESVRLCRFVKDDKV